MNGLKIYASGGVFKVIMFDSHEGKTYVYKGNDALKIIKLLNDDKGKIKNLFYSDGDLVFRIGNVKVVLCNINELKKYKELDFIFNYVKNKKYKLKKNKMQKVTAISLAMILSAIGIVSVKAASVSGISNQNNVFIESSYLDDEPSHSQNVTESVSNKDNDFEGEVLQDAYESAQPLETEEHYDEDLFETLSDELDVGVQSDSEKLNYVRENYGDIIEKYSSVYGLDANLVTAIATQERGRHSAIIDSGGAIGLMQVQVSVWDGKTIKAYNYKTNEVETINITLEKLKNVDFNIRVGCAILQEYLNVMNDNIIAAIQSYNMGPGSVRKIINNYANSCGKTYEEVLDDSSDTGWLEYRNSSYAGDPDYVEHVIRYYTNDVKEISSKK